MFVGDFSLAGFLRWWYGEGLNQRIANSTQRLARVNDFFSVGLLARTLFMPFRQLSDAHVQGSLEVKLRAFLDDIVSRVIGAILRSFMIIASFFVTAAVFAYGVVALLGWLVLPLLPAVGIAGAIVGATL